MGMITMPGTSHFNPCFNGSDLNYISILIFFGLLLVLLKLIDYFDLKPIVKLTRRILKCFISLLKLVR